MRRTSRLATILLMLAAMLLSATAAFAHPAHGPTPKKGQQTVLAYYAHDNGTSLHVVAEQRVLATRTRGVARAAITQALAKPYHDDLVTLAPKGTKVRGVNLKGGVLTLDLSRDVLRNPGVGAAGEYAFAQQLAHSATQFSNIKAVRLWVGGEPVNELWGHVDWSKPIRPDMSMIAG